MGEWGQSLLLCLGLFPVSLHAESQSGSSCCLSPDSLRWVLEVASLESLSCWRNLSCVLLISYSDLEKEHTVDKVGKGLGGPGFSVPFLQYLSTCRRQRGFCLRRLDEGT